MAFCRGAPSNPAWLATRPDTLRAPTPKTVLASLPRFQEAKLRLQEDWQGDVPWADLVLAALEIARPLLL